jgi:hypothetical protein
MYFPDLTPYEYGREEPIANVLNIGWLSAAHPFNRAVADEQFVSALGRLVAAPVNLYRGSHLCEFCPDPPSKVLPNGQRVIYPPRETTGNGEIRIVDAGGTTYVAPVLILHYVVVHGYTPPQQFIDAVLQTRGR